MFFGKSENFDFPGTGKLEGRTEILHRGGTTMIDHIHIKELISADFDGQVTAEEKKLVKSAYQDKLVEAIFEGVKDFKYRYDNME